MPHLENFRLKVFRAVAENGSFRKAGELLYLTQSAITQQIRALEEDLGVQLLDRTGRDVEVTSAGTVLLTCVRQLDELLRRAEQEIATLGGKGGGELHLGVSTTISQYVLPRMLKEFRKEHPQVRLSVQSGNTEQIVEAVVERTVSLGLIEGPPRRREVRIEPFLEDELVLIVPNSHEWADQVSLCSHDLVGTSLLMRERGSGSRRVIESALVAVGLKLKSLDIVMELDSTEAIKSAVEAGLGVGFVSRWAIANEAQLGLLKPVPITGLIILREFTLAYPAGPEPSGPAGAFRRFALENKGARSLHPHHKTKNARRS
ncbi:MAG: LysR family transcriptional regulator [Acidobacteriales bacterium]|nr:LysR family transcriptional regulator [Terriglobales bacterium]